MVTHISWHQSALNFFMNGILIHWGCSKILTVPPSQKICYLPLCCDFVLHSHIYTWLYILFCYSHCLIEIVLSFHVRFCRQYIKSLSVLLFQTVFFHYISRSVDVLLSIPPFSFREAIFGYQDLKIRLYYSAARLTTYFGISYSDKVTPDKFEGIEVRFCFVFLQSFVLLLVFLLQIQWYPDT